MNFLLTALLTYFLTIPGIYLVKRARLASSITETVSSGFFFGLGLSVIFLLTLSRFLPSVVALYFLVATCALSLFFLCREFSKERLTCLAPSLGRIDLIVVAGALAFMLISTFGDLSTTVDDDFFIHGPIVKRISMGDIPPHMPFFPDTYLRGHVGRNIFTGSIAGLLNLRPELAIIYVTLAVCPLYVLVFHALASRLAGGRRMQTCFCFLGLLFLVSGAIGTSEIRAGAITYIWNNNQIAFGHLAFFGWLACRAAASYAQSAAGGLAAFVKTHKLLLLICVLGYASMYFIYLSNFLMFSLFLVCMPFLSLLSGSTSGKISNLTRTSVLVGLTVACGLVLIAVSSTFFMERVLITLKLQNPSEPFGFMQQAHFTFPKHRLFTITDPDDNDVPFFRGSSLRLQGLSFYVGIVGLLAGFISKSPGIFAAALFGCIPMIWLLTVDMGEYRADTLRLLLTAHIGFGASAGLVLGLSVEQIFGLIDKCISGGALLQVRLLKASTLLLSVLLLAYMAKGNLDKFIAYKHHRIANNVRQFIAVHERNPETWLRRFCIRKIDNEAFEELQNLVHKPSERVLIKAVNDPKYRSYLGLMVNAATISGAGVAGVCQFYNSRGMGAPLLPSDYRSSLFWLYPTRDVLDQLAADWIVVDPRLLEPKTLKSVMSISGISLQRTLEDGDGNKRLILRYNREKENSSAAAGVKSISLAETVVNTSAQRLIRVPAEISLRRPDDEIDLQLLVLDERGRQANIMDMPLLPVEKDKSRPNTYQICFSMIQPGNWNVYIIDSKTKNRLHDIPLRVNVDNSVPLGIGE